MVASNSKIVDVPVFPEDLVPKWLQGSDISVGWFPYIHGICTDTERRPLLFYVSIDFSLGGPKFAFIIDGRRYTGNFDKAFHTYANGVLTMGSKPKITIDYHHPHKIQIDISPTMSVELNIAYRGPPLWYGKGINPVDMIDLTPSAFVGGYDAPCKIKGKVTSSAKSLSFSGYGDYGNIWILGSFKWKETNSRWIVFNDGNSFGVAAKTYDIRTGATLASTGRFGSEDESALTFDDFEWIDDNLQPPQFVRVEGLIKHLNGTVKARIDLRTIHSVNLFIPSIWTQHKMGGAVGTTTFDGSAWCETHRLVRTSESAFVMTLSRDQHIPGIIVRLYHMFSPEIVGSVRKHETLGLVVRTTFKSITKALRLLGLH